jgi:spastic paraplegia 7
VSFPEENENSTEKPYSKNLARIIDEEARRIVTEAYENTEKVLKENSEKLKILAEALLVKETLNYDEGRINGLMA